MTILCRYRQVHISCFAPMFIFIHGFRAGSSRGAVSLGLHLARTCSSADLIAEAKLSSLINHRLSLPYPTHYGMFLSFALISAAWLEVGSLALFATSSYCSIVVSAPSLIVDCLRLWSLIGSASQPPANIHGQDSTRNLEELV